MNRWVKIGGGVLALAWAPFLYAELTSDPHEKESRLIPEQEDPDPAAVVAIDAAADKEETDEEKQAATRALAEQTEKPNDDPGVEPEAMEALAEPDNEPTGAAAQDAPLPKKQGPLPELKGAFDSEPRDALWAKDAEGKIGAVFTGEDMPESLFEKSACQTTVCRVELTWSQENAAPYLDAVDELHKAFGADFAVDPQAPADKEGEDALAIHVYVMRKGYTVADLK